MHNVRREHLHRLLSAVVIIPPLILFLLYASELLFFFLICVVISLCLYEYFRMLIAQQLPVCRSSAYIAALALAVMGYWGTWQGFALTLFLGMVLLTLHVIIASHEVVHCFPMWLHSTFGMIFIGWCLSHLLFLRGLPNGQYYVLFLCSVVWTGDSIALYTGKTFGRHKLCPLVSPGKTWEGAIGGMVGGIFAAIISGAFLPTQFSPGESIMVGFVTMAMAQMSDLGESMLKRYAKVKDSGSLIPGHGGLLDRIDSMFFAAPTLVYTLIILFNLASS